MKLSASYHLEEAQKNRRFKHCKEIMVLDLIVYHGTLMCNIKLKVLQGIVHQKMTICWKMYHDADTFVSSAEQIWRNVALYHLLTNGSSVVNGCRQNESINR